MQIKFYFKVDFEMEINGMQLHGSNSSEVVTKYTVHK